METLSARTILEFKYDSEKERTEHVRLMESEGFVCSGQVKKADSLFSEHYWYAHFMKVIEPNSIKELKPYLARINVLGENRIHAVSAYDLEHVTNLVNELWNKHRSLHFDCIEEISDPEVFITKES